MDILKKTSQIWINKYILCPISAFVLLFFSFTNQLSAQSFMSVSENSSTSLSALSSDNSVNVINNSPDMWTITVGPAWTFLPGGSMQAWAEPDYSLSNPTINFITFTFPNTITITSDVLDASVVPFPNGFTFAILIDVPLGHNPILFFTFNDIANEVAVPEPTTMVILSSTFVAAMFRKHRRKVEA